MLLTNRARLATLMAEAGVSARELSAAAGWRSHSYMNRLLSGEANTCRPEPAVLIAERLGVDLAELFTPQVTRHSSRDDQLASIEEVAAYLQVPVKTVRRWRLHNQGPRGIRIGNHVRFRWSDVEAWLASRAS